MSDSMAGWRQIITFFAIVSPVPRLMKTTFCGITMCAVVVVGWDPDRAGAALLPVLVLQLFATSSGFMLSARRGHYDLLLTRGHPRVRIAVVHWAVCAVPGLFAWAAVAAAEIVSTGGTNWTLARVGTLAAFLVVSTLPWAVTVALPRFAGAVGWLVTLALLAMVRPSAGAALLPPTDAMSSVAAMVALTLYPPLMVGEALAGPAGWQLVGPMIVAGASVTAAFVWIQRQDIPLEASQ